MVIEGKKKRIIFLRLTKQISVEDDDNSKKRNRGKSEIVR